MQRGSAIPLLQHSLLYVLANQILSSYGDETRSDFETYYQHWFDTAWQPWAMAAEKGIRVLQDQHIPLKVLLIPEFHALGRPTFQADYAKVAEFFKITECRFAMVRNFSRPPLRTVLNTGRPPMIAMQMQRLTKF